MASIREILTTAQTRIATECALPSNVDQSGGVSFPVDVMIGPRALNKLQAVDRARVALVLAGGVHEVTGPRVLGREPRSLCSGVLGFEAHLWAPPVGLDGAASAIGDRDDLGAYDSVETLWKCVMRALYGEHHGASALAAPPADTITVEADTKQLRGGQYWIVGFRVSVPVTEGRAATLFPEGARVGNVITGDLTITVNPSPPLPAP